MTNTHTNTVLKLYKHQALPTASHIRRLMLEPGTVDSPLRADLEIILLADASTSTPFEALSYVWGDDGKSDAILIAGRSLSITPNLAEVLRQVRLPDERRAVWADSICIDQANAEEKGQQVALMGEIYTQSSCTNICLGLKQPEYARDAAALIADVDTMMQVTFNDPAFSWDWNAFPWPHKSDPLVVDRRWESWGKLVTRPWFERGWVVQEAALGSEAYLYWGQEKVEWISLLRVNLWLTERVFHSMPTLRQWAVPSTHSTVFPLRRREEAKTLFAKEGEAQLEALPTLPMLDKARKLSLMDPKDRIYAFMALTTSDRAMPALKPDYRKQTSHCEVYRQFAVGFLEQTSNLDLLSYVQYGAADDEDDTLFDDPQLSSWVPQWDCGKGQLGLLYTRRKIGGDSEHVEIISGGSALRVRAVIFDSLVLVCEKLKYIPDNPQKSLKQVVEIWRTIGRQSSRYPSPYGRHQAEAFLRTLYRGVYNESWQEWGHLVNSFAQLLESDKPDRSIDSYAGERDIQRLSAVETDYWSDRRLLLLGRGYYGSASKFTRVGDVCAVIMGTRCPSILRKVSGHSDHYRIIGPVYVPSKAYSKESGILRLGQDELCEDWREWDLPMEEIVLC